MFDLDGTIANSEPGIRASCLATLRTMGHEPGDLDVSAFIGPPLEEVLRAVLAPFGEDRLDLAVETYRAHYGTTGLLETTAYPGVVEIVERLSALGTRMFVATSKRRVFAERIIETLGLAAHFEAVYGSEPGGALDRKAELIAHLLRDRQLASADCLMIGDRKEDVLGAKANGVKTIGVLWGYGGREELETAGALRIIASPDELLTFARS